MNTFLSIIIPVYNEEKRVLTIISKISAYLSHGGLAYEIIVVDDGSTDKYPAHIHSDINNCV